MSREIQRVTRSTRLPPEQAAELAKVRAQLEAERPDIEARAKARLLEVRKDRESIAKELDELASQNERLVAAAADDTLSGHLRRAIHASRRPLPKIASDAGIDTESLLQFLEGEHGLPSETLDRLARASGVVVMFQQVG
jgi:uncharacterized protein YyaL (SSP411 family)